MKKILNNMVLCLSIAIVGIITMPQNIFAQTITPTPSTTISPTPTVTVTPSPTASITPTTYPTAANTSVMSIPLCEITRTLKTGSSGEDVQCIQRFLNWAGFTIAQNGPGSPGNESIYYGSLTANAVTQWQNTNSSQILAPSGLSFGTGIFGPASFNFYVALVRDAFGM